MTPAEQVTLHHGDCLTVLRADTLGYDHRLGYAPPLIPDASVDAVVTDPPAGIAFMGKSWDGDKGGREQWSVWLADVMREALRVTKPGGHALVWALPRTAHWTACGLEDAGWEIRDRITHLYGSGFPKSLDVSKAIDKRPGVGRHPEFAADLRAAMAAKGYTNTFDVAEAVVGRRTGAVANWQKYQWPEAKWWPALRDLLDMGEAKWGPVIAEAERIRTGRHLSGIKTGDAGAGGGGEGKDRRDVPATDAARQWQGWGTALKPGAEDWWVARKPLSGTVSQNVLAHGTGALNIGACRVPGEVPSVPQPVFSREMTAGFGASEGRNGAMSAAPAGRWPTNVVLSSDAAEALDAEVGTLKSGANPTRRSSDKFRDAYGEFRGQEECTPARGADEGGPSRFFPTFKYAAKAPTRERPTYVKDDGTKIAHPTVKSLPLIEWLVRLVTPPGGTVLEPFAGSGTTVEACLTQGFRCIAIEREADYLPLIEARIARAVAAPPALFPQEGVA